LTLNVAIFHFMQETPHNKKSCPQPAGRFPHIAPVDFHGMPG